MSNTLKSPLHVVILAAGKGTRMKSELPKVMHPLASKSLLEHVVDAVKPMNPACIHIVYGHGGDRIRSDLAGLDVSWIEQKEQLGTGHAVMQALPQLPEDSLVLVLFGDVPLIRQETLQKLWHGHMEVGKPCLSLLTLITDNPKGYGRIIRNNGSIVGIVEEKDADSATKAIKEVNTGIMMAPSRLFHEWLPKLENANNQKEYYLTDVVEMAAQNAIEVIAEHPESGWEVEGVNDRLQLANLERVFQRQQAEEFMRDGLAIRDPSRFDLRGSLQHGRDCEIDVNALFEGDCIIGNRVRIGANCIIRNSRIGDDVTIEAYSLLEDSQVSANASVGPYARLRPGTQLGKGSRVGNFVELKNATLGNNSKVNHLSYVGDAQVGQDVNIGAGTITCNYDGANKHKTVIGDGVFVGSNSALVAPVELGANATVGAGSVVTKAVAEGELAIARARQKNLQGWQRPVKSPKDK